jgi:glycosidase
MGSMQSLAASYSQRYIVCEAPDDPKGFAVSTACGSAFAFGLQYDIVNAAKGLSMNIQRVSDYFKTAPLSMATMLSNHDSFAGERMWDQFAGNLAQYKLAAATYLLLPGRPFIYYGEEIGMAGAASLTGDAKLRTPMSWNSSASNAGFSTTMPYRAISANVATNNVATQAIDPNSLYMFYKAMLALRNTRPSITLGSYDAPFVSGNVMGFQRKQGGETSLILINYGTSDANVSVTSLPAFASLGRLFPSAAASYVADANGTVPIVLAAQSVSVFNVTP